MSLCAEGYAEWTPSVFALTPARLEKGQISNLDRVTAAEAQGYRCCPANTQYRLFHKPRQLVQGRKYIFPLLTKRLYKKIVVYSVLSRIGDRFTLQYFSNDDIPPFPEGDLMMV